MIRFIAAVTIMACGCSSSHDASASDGGVSDSGRESGDDSPFDDGGACFPAGSSCYDARGALRCCSGNCDLGIGPRSDGSTLHSDGSTDEGVCE
jgi:hypothetical protein